jgi:IclR family transcriptional regulator, KDG regulon repressor
MSKSPLHKVFSILETVVASQNKGMTYSEILAALEVPKSSVHRILKELSELGYLTFNPETKRYFGSLRLAALGAEVMSHFQLRDHIRPLLLELHRETDHTTNFGILDGIQGVFVDKIESRDFGIKLFSEIGKNFPLHSTGLGKVLLTYSSEDTLARLVQRPLQAITEKTITDTEQLKAELALIRKQGYALDNEEITRGIMCLAAPVFGFDKRLTGAVSITFPSYISTDRSLEPEIAAIKKYAMLISRSLGRR